MNKKIIIITVGIIVVVIAAILLVKYTSKNQTLNGKEITDVTLESIYSSESSTSSIDNADDNFITAADAVVEMGTGWNLGNTLDSCDFKRYSPQKSDYQIMAVYSNDTYSGWDASNAIYIGVDGFVELQWQINSLNSDINGNCGRFSIQLINNVLSNTNELTVKYEVTKAQFIKKDGSVIELQDMVGLYEYAIENNITKDVVADIRAVDELATAADIVGGELTIDLKIVEYPIVIDEQAKKVTYYETLWGNPVTTEEMIDKVAGAGFGAIRIPVTYYDHINDEGIIDEAWLARVKEIVDYALDNGLYCIINTHHDSGKLFTADMDTINEQKKNVINIWTQIANYFRDYDDKLIFESFNEILNAQSQWSDAGADSYKAVNILNQCFVDTIRSTGANNGYRNLILNTYANSYAQDVLGAFSLPVDRVEGHLIAEIHYYSNLEEEPAKMDETFNRLNQYFIEKSIPVIVGEFASEANWNKDDGINYINSFMTKAKEYSIAVFWWDAGGKRDINSPGTEQLLNRENITWYSPDKVEAILVMNE